VLSWKSHPVILKSLFSWDSIRSIRRSFSISADELGRVAYVYPLPEHIKRRRGDRWYIAIMCFLFRHVDRFGAQTVR